MSNDEWVAGKIRIPKGARLGSSNATPGADSALLFNAKTGKTMGPAEVRIGGAESELVEKVVAAAITTAAAFVFAYAPEIKDRLHGDVVPAVKAKWNKFRDGKDDGRPLEDTSGGNPEADPLSDGPPSHKLRSSEGRLGRVRPVRSVRPDTSSRRPARGRGRPEATSRPN